ncbi:MAG: UDP-N-acetylmuramate dehydrogenase [Anaerolineae bacterium]|nr:UDP-N-acetylmuramate dehydrogenase [Anaerolineae bacterium]
MHVIAAALPIDDLRAAFGGQLQESVSLARYTSARLGGPADALLIVNSAAELAAAIDQLWALQVGFVLLGGGSNVLISDAGVRGLVLLNKARKVRFDLDAGSPSVSAESGANLGAVARQAAQKGLSGLEWAAGIPGTIGGAVFGNAGAHGEEIAANLLLAEILHREKGKQTWDAADLAFNYRSSLLKRQPGSAVVLAATLSLAHAPAESIQGKMDSYLAFRRRTQPPGASMGSMFKNPPDDFAGRLIEAAGLKGHQIGAAQISPLHANFFVNHGQAAAADVIALIHLAQRTVAEKFAVRLELEVELLGDWSSSGLSPQDLLS